MRIHTTKTLSICLYFGNYSHTCVTCTNSTNNRNNRYDIVMHCNKLS